MHLFEVTARAVKLDVGHYSEALFVRITGPEDL